MIVGLGLTLIIFGALLFPYLFLRNELMYKARFRLIEKIYNKQVQGIDVNYDVLPPYNTMYFKIWIPICVYEKLILKEIEKVGKNVSKG